MRHGRSCAMSSAGRSSSSPQRPALADLQVRPERDGSPPDIGRPGRRRLLGAAPSLDLADVRRHRRHEGRARGQGRGLQRRGPRLRVRARRGPRAAGRRTDPRLPAEASRGLRPVESEDAGPPRAQRGGRMEAHHDDHRHDHDPARPCRSRRCGPASLGRVIAPDDADYDRARTVMYGGGAGRPAGGHRQGRQRRRRRPRGRARPRETGLELAVRSGGHSARRPQRGRRRDRPRPRRT